MPPDPVGPQQSDPEPGFLGSVTTQRPLRLCLEPHLQGDARGSRDGGMGVHIVLPLQRFSLETRRIEVVDVRHRGVQEVEHLKRDGDAPVEADAEMTVPHGRRFGPHGIVLDQGPRTEMAHANASEQALHRLEREGAGENAVERTWNPRSGGVVVREPRGGEREVGLGRHPGCEPNIVRTLDAVAVAWTAGGRHARIAQEDQPRIEVQIPDRHRRMQPAQPHRTHADLAAARLDQRTEPPGRLAGARVDPDRRTAHVVAVEALSPVGVERRSAATVPGSPSTWG